MPTIEGILREKTFKDEGFEVSRRVFYTLTSIEKLKPDFTCKALSVLMETLHSKGLLTDSEIDDILLKVVH